MKLLNVIISVWICYNHETSQYGFALGLDGLDCEIEPALNKQFFKYMYEECDVNNLVDSLSDKAPESNYYLIVLRTIKHDMRELLDSHNSIFPFCDIYYDFELELLPSTYSPNSHL